MKESAVKQPIVLLHGWGMDQRGWGPLMPLLNFQYQVITSNLPGFGGEPNCSDIDRWLDNLVDRLPPKFSLVGWSLGGMLSVRLAARYPSRINALVTLATNACFVQRERWQSAMAVEVFEGFLQSFQASPGSTLQRFAGLMAAGDAEVKSLIKPLREAAKASRIESSADWGEGLEWLYQIDNRRVLEQLKVPTLHLLGEEDQLVPVDSAGALKSLNPTQQICCLKGAGHALHWSQPQQVANQISDFISAHEYKVAKKKVAQSFSRAAETYDSVADLQRRVGLKLLKDMSTDEVEDILDLGTGTGHFVPHLTSQSRNLWALDLAFGMLTFARGREHHSARGWVCGDAEQLPFVSESMDRIFSAMVIQWCADLSALFGELERVSKPGGTIHIATLGPDTLYELRESWRAVDGYVHVNHFAPDVELKRAIEQSGLDIQGWKTERETLRYEKVSQLTSELKSLGAHNMNAGQSSGLTGRQRLKRFQQAYEAYRDADGLLSATYEVYYLSLVKR